MKLFNSHHVCLSVYVSLSLWSSLQLGSTTYVPSLLSLTLSIHPSLSVLISLSANSSLALFHQHGSSPLSMMNNHPGGFPGFTQPPELPSQPLSPGMSKYPSARTLEASAGLHSYPGTDMMWWGWEKRGVGGLGADWICLMA